MPSDPRLVRGVNLLGRDTAANVAHFGSVVATAGVVPPVFRGPLPRKSPDNHRFINRRYAGQLIGCCTGEAVAHAAETIVRMPADRSIASVPLPPHSISPLYAYRTGRDYARERGVRLGAEGGVGSFVVFAAKDSGLASWENYPATDQAYAAYRDATPLPGAAAAEGPRHRILQCGVVPSWRGLLELLAAGFPVPIGLPIPEGIMRTDDSGRFVMKGQEVGGHEVCALDYDMDADRFYIFNSWANGRWGALERHPEQDPRCGGYNNVGWCTMAEMEAVFSPSAMASGEVEACAINMVEGWAPKLHSFVEAYA